MSKWAGSKRQNLLLPASLREKRYNIMKKNLLVRVELSTKKLLDNYRKKSGRTSQEIVETALLSFLKKAKVK